MLNSHPGRYLRAPFQQHCRLQRNVVTLSVTPSYGVGIHALNAHNGRLVVVRLFSTGLKLHDTSQPSTPLTSTQPKPPKEEGPLEIVLREAKEAKEKEKDKLAASSTEGSSPPALAASDSAVSHPEKKSGAVQVETKKSLWERTVHEVQHYWEGLKLLWVEVKISGRLFRKLLNGSKLTRREQRQLRRTTGDLARLVPFMIIVLVPFLELALPLILYLFPNMLPSTFESKFQQEEKRKKLLKVRLEMAKFLQETVEEVSVSGTAASAAQEYNAFFKKYRNSGEQAPTDEILKIASKFHNELTLQNLSRPQLVSMARYMNVIVFGTDTFLRNQIERRLNNLKADDRMIAAEGVDSLTIPELQQICQSRGIRVTGVSPARLRSELSQWLELHLKYNIPSTILILSRAFTLSDRIPATTEEAVQRNAEALQAALTALPDQVMNEAALKMHEAEGTATYKQKLNVLQEQEELIADELEQEAAEEEQKKSKELEKANELEKAKEKLKEQTTDTAVTQSPATSEEKQVAPIEPTEQEHEVITEKELQKLGDALKTCAAESPLDELKEKLDELKEDHKEFKEDLEELKEVANVEPGKVATALSERVNRMITKIEAELARTESAIGSKLKIVQPEDGHITITELEEVLKVLADHPDDDRIKRIVKKLDRDDDGRVALTEIIHLASETEKEGYGVVIDPAAPKNATDGKSADLKPTETSQAAASTPIATPKI
ncbi:LETM1-like protein-domain-containing protein [Cladochytrium replicatum]|nr:LETM1-like protein-domain-containing protein [Cladochytrium replicatum]